MKRLRLKLLLGVMVACLGVWLWLVWLERSYRETPYSLIEEGLYVGRYVSEPPPGTEAVVNLLDAKDPYQAEACLWAPILDGPPVPSIEWLKRVVEFIKTQREAGLTVYVHCANGVSRSGMVSTAYLMQEHNWTRDQALAFVCSKRPEVRPNPVFMQLLTEWEQALKEPSRRKADSSRDGCLLEIKRP
jgi:protein-tyrosine phosphatase